MNVHLRSDGTCYPAVILARGGGDLLLLRVSQPTPRTARAIGSQDSEGWYRHESTALTVHSPGGTMRKLDGWHLGFERGNPDAWCTNLDPALPDTAWPDDARIRA